MIKRPRWCQRLAINWWPVFLPEFWSKGVQGGGVAIFFYEAHDSYSLIIKLYSTIWLFGTIVLHTIAVYLHLYNCLVMVTINTDWLCMHAIILMGGATASETLIRGYICIIGGCSTPQKQPRENTANDCRASGMNCSYLNCRLLIVHQICFVVL